MGPAVFLAAWNALALGGAMLGLGLGTLDHHDFLTAVGTLAAVNGLLSLALWWDGR